jgi:hypothetical protein
VRKYVVEEIRNPNGDHVRKYVVEEIRSPNGDHVKKYVVEKYVAQIEITWENM